MTTVQPAPPSAGGGTASAEVARARIAVMVSSYQVDVVVPTRFTIETFIDDLVSVLAAAIEDEEIDFTPPAGQWSLARPGEQPMPRWRSLADHEIVDGTALMLTTVESAEVFTPVVEDITDALALINEREFAEFDADTAAIVGLSVLGVGAVASATMLSWMWTQTGSMVWCGLPALLLGVVCWGSALAARNRGAAERISLGLALTSVPLLFAGSAMLVPPAHGEPGPLAPANIAAGAVVVAVAMAATMRVTGSGIATLMAVTGLGVVITMAVIPLTYLDLLVRQVAGGAVFVGLILLTLAPRIAVAIARIRPPDLPDPGSEVSPGTLTDIFDAASTSDGDTDAEAPDDSGQRENNAVGIESRARLAVTSLRGLITAVSALLAIATVICAVVSPGGIREIIMGTAVAGLLAMRSRWYPDRVQALALVIGSAIVVLGLGAVLVGHYESSFARLTVVILVVAAACGACVAALRLPGKRLTPVTRRVIDLIEYLLILVVPVIAFWIMGVYTAMRGL
ncbi:type VII secretion integral membrane protein EccD [Nocardia sp. NBC_01329]|uniref:type VII secretion integral membrane protein EccD n=1 Tax=Nocardia sp. NBC_01329 TaxID=2903594 RepID=UPI002E103143|nr:type VII secretion integral membrane protein EccD [Nocardia sp. NBC_01329]